MTTRRFWTAEEDAILCTLYADMLTADVAERVGRTAGAVHQRARSLGLSKSITWIAKTARRSREAHRLSDGMDATGASTGANERGRT